MKYGDGGVLVVAGEASGDLAAAAVLREMGEARAFGMGGTASRAAGAEIIVDMRSVTAMGLGGVARRALSISRAWRAIVREAERRRPAAALLVNYTEFNVRLARRLRRQGTRIVFYGAPQVWAWRPERARTVAPLVDHMAVMFPFEEALWRSAGADTHWVGHPAVETTRHGREAARQALGLTARAEAIALLPGSRPHEVRRLLPAMLGAFEQLRGGRGSLDARVLLAPSLDPETLASAEASCRRAGVTALRTDAISGVGPHLDAFDAALTASGTASLECALAGAPPVIVYKVDPITELAARLLIQTTHIALPNVLLGRRAFAELLQRDARADKMAREIARVLDAPDDPALACREVARTLERPGPPPSARVAALLSPHFRAALRPRAGDGIANVHV